MRDIKDLGSEHSLQVATEILQSGLCTEVEEKRSQPQFRSLKVFVLNFIITNNRNHFLKKSILGVP